MGHKYLLLSLTKINGGIGVASMHVDSHLHEMNASSSFVILNSTYVTFEVPTEVPNQVQHYLTRKLS